MRTLLDEILSQNYEDQETKRVKPRPPSYAQMQPYYPLGGPEQVKSLIGGRVNQNWITNTCVIRVSRALNYAGHPIPGNFSGLLTVRGGDNKHYALRVREFKRYLIAKYGQPDLAHQNPGLSGAVPQSFIGKKGIILFEVSGWSDATGHVTLWNGSRCVNNDCYWDKARSVFLWESNSL